VPDATTSWEQHVDAERAELAVKINAALEHVRDLERELIELQLDLDDGD
jgi:hypothetical protein